MACRTLLSWENASLTVDSFYVILIAFPVLSFCSANKALLLSNLGRLMRLCAQAVGGVETKLTGRRGEFTLEERGYFNKVLYCFSMRRLSRCPAGPVLVFCPSADVQLRCVYIGVTLTEVSEAPTCSLANQSFVSPLHCLLFFPRVLICLLRFSCE